MSNHVCDFDLFFNFTLYLWHSRIRRGDLVIKHSVSNFLPKFRCVLSGGNQSSALPWHKSEIMKVLYTSSPRVGSATCCIHSHKPEPLRHDWLHTYLSVELNAVNNMYSDVLNKVQPVCFTVTLRAATPRLASKNILTLFVIDCFI